MSTKKSPQADIEKKRSGFLQIGLIASIGLTLAAFEYTTFEEKEKTLVNAPESEIFEPAPIPFPPKPKPEPEKKIKQENKDVVKSTSSTTMGNEIKKVSDNTEEKQTGVIGDSIPVTLTFDDEKEPEIISCGDFEPVEEWPYFPKFKKIKDPVQRKKKTEDEMKNFIGGKVKYTQKMKELNITGTVTISYVINKEGKVDPSRIKVTRGLHEDLEKQIIDAVLQMPELIPGMQRRRPVDVPYSIAIKFVLK